MIKQLAQWGKEAEILQRTPRASSVTDIPYKNLMSEAESSVAVSEMRDEFSRVDR